MKQNQLQKFPKMKCSYRLIPSICRERKGKKLIKSTEKPTQNDENILSWGGRNLALIATRNLSLITT